MRSLLLLVATTASLGGATRLDAQRALGDRHVSCERVFVAGPVTTTYYSRLDVEDGMLVVRAGGDLYQDAAGKLRTIPSGKSGASAMLLPSARRLAPGVREMKVYGEEVGFVIRQSSAGKSWSSNGYLQTSFDGALSIPGVVRGDGSVSYRVTRNGRVLCRPDEDAAEAISDHDAPAVTISNNFQKGEERTWLSGPLTVEILHRDQLAASYLFDTSQLKTEAIRMAIEPGILNTRYRPGELPTGCVLKENE